MGSFFLPLHPPPPSSLLSLTNTARRPSLGTVSQNNLGASLGGSLHENNSSSAVASGKPGDSRSLVRAFVGLLLMFHFEETRRTKSFGRRTGRSKEGSRRGLRWSNNAWYQIRGIEFPWLVPHRATDRSSSFPRWLGAQPWRLPPCPN